VPREPGAFTSIRIARGFPVTGPGGIALWYQQTSPVRKAFKAAPARCTMAFVPFLFELPDP